MYPPFCRQSSEDTWLGQAFGWVLLFAVFVTVLPIFMIIMGTLLVHLVLFVAG